MAERQKGLAELLEKGGVVNNITGTTLREVLSALVHSYRSRLPISPETLFEAVLEREAMMSTGFGKGIAFPHPRNPIVTAEDDQFATLAFLKYPVDWNSLDGERVDTLVLIVTASARQHLRILSEITYFCRQDAFSKMLKEHASLENILRYIREAERKWK